MDMKLILLVISLIFLIPNSSLASNDGPRSMLPGTVETMGTAASELLVQAMSLIGINYRYGGKTPEAGFDCSGFVGHVFREAVGVTLPDTAYQMSLVGQKVSNNELQPGDLVFYNTLKRAFSHVGIYVGNNKFIHSPSPGRAVEIVDMKENYWLSRYQGARRVADLEQTTESSPPARRPVQSDIGNADLSANLY
jgi:cell wall-associated NlpC family hydrolase